MTACRASPPHRATASPLSPTQCAIRRPVRKCRSRGALPAGVRGGPAPELGQVGADPQQPGLGRASLRPPVQQPADQPQVGVDPVPYGRAAEPVVQPPQAQHAGLQPLHHAGVDRPGRSGLLGDADGAGLLGVRAVAGRLGVGRVPVGYGVAQGAALGDGSTGRVGRGVVQEGGEGRAAALRGPGQPVRNPAVRGQPARPGPRLELTGRDAERAGQGALAVGLGHDPPVLPAPDLLPARGHRHAERAGVVRDHPRQVLVAPPVPLPYVRQRMRGRRGRPLPYQVASVHSPGPHCAAHTHRTAIRFSNIKVPARRTSGATPIKHGSPRQTPTTLRDYTETTGPAL